MSIKSQLGAMYYLANTKPNKFRIVVFHGMYFYLRERKYIIGKWYNDWKWVDIHKVILKPKDKLSIYKQEYFKNDIPKT